MDPRRPRWGRDTPETERTAQRAAAADGYIADAARFEVEDGDEPVVVHHVEISLVPTGRGARSAAPSSWTATARA